MSLINHLAKGNNFIRRLTSKIGGILIRQLVKRNTPIFELKRRIKLLPLGQMVDIYHVNILQSFERNRCALACVYRLSAPCLQGGGS